MLKVHVANAKTVIVIAVVLLLFLGSQLYSSRPAIPRWSISKHDPSTTSTHYVASTDADLLPCQRLPGADDVVFVMRTGATEIQDKLPAHLNTTFRCYKDFIIFSDYEEAFEGYAVRDVLAPLDQELIETNPDFGLYLRLKQYGRASLRPDELSGKASFEGSKSGKKDNAGWRLDKFKFLPMMGETLKLRPDKKWYVFVESDSYPVYSNILQWLATLDPEKPGYYGSEVMIGPDLFAHGGSVFVMSRPAVEIGAQYYADHEEEMNTWAANHWAGDCVLGKFLRDAGVPLTFSWPMFQGGHPDKMDFNDRKPERILWCTAALSYHHFSPSELEKMWNFEQAWIQSRLDAVSEEGHEKRWSFWSDYSNVLEHRDVFRNFVMPKILEGHRGWWNNLAPTLIDDTRGKSPEDCRKLCESTSACMQYTSSPDGCSISTKEVMFGEPLVGTKSGWLTDRIDDWMTRLDGTCAYEGFVNL